MHAMGEEGTHKIQTPQNVGRQDAARVSDTASLSRDRWLRNKIGYSSGLLMSPVKSFINLIMEQSALSSHRGQSYKAGPGTASGGLRRWPACHTPVLQ